MRSRWREEIPSLTVFALFLLLAGSLAFVMGPGTPSPRSAADPFPVDPVRPIGPDSDNDTYADVVDLWSGNSLARLWIEASGLDLDAQHYFLVGTQDDHWRLGAGRELEWTHVVDPDPLGRDPGSPAWQDMVLRTGTWQTAPADGPQTFLVDVREDRPTVGIRLELWDGQGSPDTRMAAWDLALGTDAWTLGETTHDVGKNITLPGGEATVRLERVWDLDPGTKSAVAARWAPTLHFSGAERFYPSDGDGLERFHGIVRPEPDLRTWDLDFNNGQDRYQILAADFDGDHDTDHDDVWLMTDVLRAGDVLDATVYAHVAPATGDRVVVQYWFVYPYNFVLDETGAPIERLAHPGDREFIQLLFEDVDAALTGSPDAIAYSQHYTGIAIPLDEGSDPVLVDGRPQVYVARGSHASYPVPGDDSSVRSSLAGYHDEFDGQGETWTREDYHLEVLDDQSWFSGYRWGPLTRSDRLPGTSFRPVLRHAFTYPFHDPVTWMESLPQTDPESLFGLYNSPEDAP